MHVNATVLYCVLIFCFCFSWQVSNVCISETMLWSLFVSTEHGWGSVWVAAWICQRGYSAKDVNFWLCMQITGGGFLNSLYRIFQKVRKIQLFFLRMQFLRIYRWWDVDAHLFLFLIPYIFKKVQQIYFFRECNVSRSTDDLNFSVCMRRACDGGRWSWTSNLFIFCIFFRKKRAKFSFYICTNLHALPAYNTAAVLSTQ